MAEEPKKEDKEKGGGGGGIKSSSQAFAELGGILIALLMVEELYRRLIGNGPDSFLQSPFVRHIESYSHGFKVVSVIISVIFGIAAVYLTRHINMIHAEEHEELYPHPQPQTQGEIVNREWQRIIDHLDSPNASDWKLAVIEADIILNDILEKSGYHGDTVGEKLKQVEKSDFTTIDKAWEAHKVRNMIAHEGSGFELTRKEAFRTIGLYKEVFEEFLFL